MAQFINLEAQVISGMATFLWMFIWIYFYRACCAMGWISRLWKWDEAGHSGYFQGRSLSLLLNHVGEDLLTLSIGREKLFDPTSRRHKLSIWSECLQSKCPSSSQRRQESLSLEICTGATAVSCIFVMCFIYMLLILSTEWASPLFGKITFTEWH